ncbi:MAG: SAM-dependent methyltransferase [Herbinix sp.]|jgi:ubiquinone/menaquinone biosynthesis C-methylase UbiE|nr:SAM-dependent methyltransferase [Herbinix sp.]
MVESKGWEWNLADQKIWTEPCEESYYYASKWKKENCHSVLDLGCGLGRHSILFAKHGYKVTALDISKEGIEYLKQWQRQENVDILCKIADMKQLPFSNDAFDCIFAYHSISHTDSEGISQIISEISRVLKPEGKIFLTLCSKETWSFTEASFKRIDENTVIKTDGPEINVPHFYVNLEDIEKLFHQYSINRIRHIDDCYFNGRKQNNKHYYIEAELHKKPMRIDYSNIIGKAVEGIIDRPLGSCHSRYPDIKYSVNYGYIEGIYAGDGDEQDIYLLGVDTPMDRFSGTVIAVYHRYNDNEDKWIVTPDGRDMNDDDILKAINFQEKFYDGKLYRL